MLCLQCQQWQCLPAGGLQVHALFTVPAGPQVCGSGKVSAAQGVACCVPRTNLASSHTPSFNRGHHYSDKHGHSSATSIMSAPITRPASSTPKLPLHCLVRRAHCRLHVSHNPG